MARSRQCPSANERSVMDTLSWTLLIGALVMWGVSVLLSLGLML